jgi:hypothetical protein
MTRRRFKSCCPDHSPKSSSPLNVKIERSTGEYILGNQKLGRDLNEREFLRSALGLAAKKIPAGSRNYYEIWQQVDPELEVGITVGFQPGGPLERIRIKFVKAGMRSAPWSKDMEEDIKRLHDLWLQEQLGNLPYQFAWGKALSTFEPHWYSANIVIDYTRPSQHFKTVEQ